MSIKNPTLVGPNGIPGRLAELAGSDEPAEVARYFGMSWQAAKNYLLRGRLPELEMLIKICEQTGVSMTWFVMGIGPKYLPEIDGEDSRQRFYLHLSPDQREEVRVLAEKAKLSVDEQLKRLVIAALFTIRYSTEKELPSAFIKLMVPTMTSTGATREAEIKVKSKNRHR